MIVCHLAGREALVQFADDDCQLSWFNRQENPANHDCSTFGAAVAAVGA